MALKVLSALDSAKIQWFHYKAIIVAGMGLFTDAYDLFCIPPIMILLSRIYYGPNYEIPAEVNSIMLGTSIFGTVVGQVVSGYLGDRIGRRRVYGLSLMLMVLSSLLCGLTLGTSKACVMVTLGFFRFVLGLGIGGDYPLSATIMAEFANRMKRGAFIAAVFSMQGFGILVSSVVTMVVCAVFDRATQAKPGSAGPWVADLAWRMILMLGAVPAGLTCYWRMMMPETARYTALVRRDVEQATRDMQTLSGSLSRISEEIDEVEEEEDCPTNIINPQISSNLNYSLFSKQFLHRHGRDLFACATCWFLVDIVYYSNNLFQYPVFKLSADHKSKLTAFQEAFLLAKIQFILAISSTIPGYFAAVYLIDRVGRVAIQMAGFLFMGLTLFALGLPQIQTVTSNYKAHAEFWILYGLTFFFANFGPNTTTFIVPAELFPARLRSTCHGISGAVGKIGAIIGSIGFLWASREKDKGGIGLKHSLVILGGVCILGTVITYFFTFETKQRSLEENEKDDDQTNGVWLLRSILDPCRHRVFGLA